MAVTSPLATAILSTHPGPYTNTAGFQAYEMEDDVSKDLAEFALANAIFTALVEGHAAEISARRTAMENASNVSIWGSPTGRDLATLPCCEEDLLVWV
jgi:hypothetical protein